jgi:hypothetical protein
LTKLPYGKPEVDDFQEDHLKIMELVMGYVRNYFAKQPKHLKDWNQWYLIFLIFSTNYVLKLLLPIFFFLSKTRYDTKYPKSDAATYIKELGDEGLYVPLLKELFLQPDGSSVEDNSCGSIEPPSLYEDSSFLKAVAQPSIIHRFSKHASPTRILEEDPRIASRVISKPKRLRKRKLKPKIDEESGMYTSFSLFYINLHMLNLQSCLLLFIS